MRPRNIGVVSPAGWMSIISICIIVASSLSAIVSQGNPIPMPTNILSPEENDVWNGTQTIEWEGDKDPEGGWNAYCDADGLPDPENPPYYYDYVIAAELYWGDWEPPYPWTCEFDTTTVPDGAWYIVIQEVGPWPWNPDPEVSGLFFINNTGDQTPVAPVVWLEYENISIGFDDAVQAYCLYTFSAENASDMGEYEYGITLPFFKKPKDVVLILDDAESIPYTWTVVEYDGEKYHAVEFSITFDLTGDGADTHDVVATYNSTYKSRLSPKDECRHCWYTYLSETGAAWPKPIGLAEFNFYVRQDDCIGGPYGEEYTVIDYYGYWLAQSSYTDWIPADNRYISWDQEVDIWPACNLEVPPDEVVLTWDNMDIGFPRMYWYVFNSPDPYSFNFQTISGSYDEELGIRKLGASATTWSDTWDNLTGYYQDRMYYVVRAWNIIYGWSENSTMVSWRWQTFTFNSDAANINWFSVPHNMSDVDGDGELSSMDLVYLIEGSPSTRNYITYMYKWDAANQSCMSSRWLPVIGWTAPFPIYPGDGIAVNFNGLSLLFDGEEIGILITATDMNGTQRTGYNSGKANINWLSLPYSMGDMDGDGNLTTDDVVLMIEGTLTTRDYITYVYVWDADTQSSSSSRWTAISGGQWTSAIDIEPGDGIAVNANGVSLINEGDYFTWEYELASPNVPGDWYNDT